MKINQKVVSKKDQKNVMCKQWNTYSVIVAILPLFFPPVSDYFLFFIFDNTVPYQTTKSWPWHVPCKYFCKNNETFFLILYLAFLSIEQKLFTCFSLLPGILKDRKWKHLELKHCARLGVLVRLYIAFNVCRAKQY